MAVVTLTALIAVGQELMCLVKKNLPNPRHVGTELIHELDILRGKRLNKISAQVCWKGGHVTFRNYRNMNNYNMNTGTGVHWIKTFLFSDFYSKLNIQYSIEYRSSARD